jgi:plastocyanin
MRLRIGIIGIVALAALAACGGYTSTYGGGGGGGGGPVGSVTIGPGIEFVSGHNGSTNAAVDTIPVGGTVTWTWSGSLPHGVQSRGSASFASSATMTGNGTYAVTFPAPGTYQYDCAVHGQLMTGTVVVR